MPWDVHAMLNSFAKAGVDKTGAKGRQNGRVQPRPVFSTEGLDTIQSIPYSGIDRVTISDNPGLEVCHNVTIPV